MSCVANQLELSASIAEIDSLRYTPSGVPALNATLEHASEVIEEGQTRQVKVSIRSVAFGAVAERLARQAIGSNWCFKGFLASPRNSRQVVFHIQEFASN